MRQLKVSEPKMVGGILFEIEAHLAPLGWHYEELYEDPNLMSDLTVYLSNFRDRDRWLSEDECHFGSKYYKEEKAKISFSFRKHKNENDARNYQNADRRSKAALKGLNAARVERKHLGEKMAELKDVIAALKTGNRYQSRLPSCYSEEALLP